jgi:hypothetical protein
MYEDMTRETVDYLLAREAGILVVDEEQPGRRKLHWGSEVAVRLASSVGILLAVDERPGVAR